MLNVGELLGLKQGDNPHQWYSPASVHARGRNRSSPTTTGSTRPAPVTTPCGSRRSRRRALARYDQLRAQIRARYAGTPVGYSESIFRPLGEDLGLKLLTPYSFAKAIAEGGEVTAADKQTVDRQAERREIKVWVFNSQNVTPDVQRVNEIARAHGIPIATVTETLSPASDTFEQWQVTQLEGLMRALGAGDGAMSATGVTSVTGVTARWGPGDRAARGERERRWADRVERGEHEHGPAASSSRCWGRTGRASRRC